MRWHNRNPARRANPYPVQRSLVADDAFINFLSRRPILPKRTERRPQSEHDESDVVPQQQEQSRGGDRVILGSVPLSLPVPTSQESQSLLIPTTRLLARNNPEALPSQDILAQSSEQNFLGPNPFSPANYAHLPSPAAWAQVSATLSSDAKNEMLNLGSLAIG